MISGQMQLLVTRSLRVYNELSILTTTSATSYLVAILLKEKVHDEQDVVRLSHG